MEEYTFDREETHLPSSPDGSGTEEGQEEEEERADEEDAWHGGGEEELEETNSFDGSYEDEDDDQAIILSPRPRTDIVPPRAPGLYTKDEDEVPLSPAFAFDL